MTEVIQSCLRAALRPDIFEEWEFGTLMGLERREVAAILEAWPDPPAAAPEGYSTGEDAQRTAVNNVLNNLLGYPHGLRGDDFVRAVGVTEQEVADALQQWRQECDLDAGAVGHPGYFDRLE